MTRTLPVPGVDEAVTTAAMPLSERLERDGVWLFRYRSHTPLVPLAAIVMAIAIDPPAERLGWTLASVALGLVGIAIRAATIARTPAGTSGRTTGAPMASALNTSGMYSVVRHPLYVGNYLMWLGAMVFTRSWAVVLGVSLFYWLQYERIALAEERLLRERFGPAFEEWSSRVPAFVPRWRQWQAPALPFSWRAVIGREFTGLYGLVATLTLLEVVRASAIARRLTLVVGWRRTFALATVAYLTVLALRRTTRLFKVEGR